jgi:glycosyltransferase involved in cell wall biosynthesis
MNASGAGKVIQIASSHKMGLTAQETELAIAYRKLNYFNLLVVTGENEQFKGCFTKLSDNKVKNTVINGFDEHHEFFRLVREFVKQCDTFQPQVVTLNTNWQLLIVGVARIICKTKFKIIYTIHGFRHNEKIKTYFARFLIGMLLYLFADKVNAPTNYVAKKFFTLKSKIFSIPLGEDQLFFERSMPIKFDSELRLIFAGQFREGKNQDMLILALCDYMKQTGDKNIVLYLPGSGSLFPAAQQLAKDYEIEDVVIFPGQLSREEILDLYNKCQIAVAPTNSETFGHCIAEPLVLQRILISKHVGVAIDVVRHGENGFFFETKKDLVNCLKEIREMSPEKLNMISKNAKTTGEMFRWDNIAARHYHEVFKKFF